MYTKLSDEALEELKKLADDNEVEYSKVFDGHHWTVHFKNGYYASIVKHCGSYGSGRDLFEVALLDENKLLCYDTPITDDVIGYLTEEDVLDICNKIHNLPPQSESNKESECAEEDSDLEAERLRQELEFWEKWTKKLNYVDYHTKEEKEFEVVEIPAQLLKDLIKFLMTLQ